MKEGKYLLAFSGGPDSVYLLECLAVFYKEKLNQRICLCYINYHDSPNVDEEEKIVNFYVDKYKLKLFRFDTRFRKGNFEEWARNYRYKKFAYIIKKKGMKALLTAHQKDDDSETYLLQKERGNLPAHYGLQEAATLNGIKILRPLLSVSKEEIYSELKENGYIYYEDITNHDSHTKRNVIRKELSSVERERLLDEKEAKNQELIKLYNSFVSIKYPVSFSLYDNLKEEAKRRLIFYLLDKEKTPSKRRTGLGKEIYEFLKKRTNSEMPLFKEKVLYKTKDYFFIHTDLKKLNYSFTYKHKKRYSNRFFSIDLTDIKKFNLLSLPVTIRNRREGDTISTDLPTKDVKRFLKKQQVPYFLIDIYPVFEVDNQIRCVPFYKDIKNKSIPLDFKLLNPDS